MEVRTLKFFKMQLLKGNGYKDFSVSLIRSVRVVFRARATLYTTETLISTLPFSSLLT